MRAEYLSRSSDSHKHGASELGVDIGVLERVHRPLPAETGDSLAEGLIGLRHWPVMVVDQKARILTANAAAHELLKAKTDWFAGAAGDLRCPGPGATADLQMKIREVSYALPPSRTRLAWQMTMEDGQQTLVVLSKLAAPQRDGPQFNTAAPVLVTLHCGRPAGSTVEQQILVDAFDFTRAEARLALALLEGQTPSSYASASGVKISTVRWHLSHALDKSGCANQRDLVLLLAWLIAI